MRIDSERLRNRREHNRKVLDKWIGNKSSHYMSMEEAAGIVGISVPMMQNYVAGRANACGAVLSILAEHLPPDFACELWEPSGLIVKRPFALQQACPHKATAMFAHVTAVFAKALENDGKITRDEEPACINAVRRAVHYGFGWLARKAA